MSGLGAAMNGGNGERAEDDFYRTPPEATLALLAFLREKGMLPRSADISRAVKERGELSVPRIWEPACGDGAIAEVLVQSGFRVTASDVRDRGYGTPGVNFLGTGAAVAPVLITNPPFSHGLPEAFVRHAFRIGVKTVCLLLKATYWNARERDGLWRAHPPRHVCALTWRLDFTGAGAPAMDCAWNVWVRGFPGPPMLHRLPRPAAGQEEMFA